MMNKFLFLLSLLLLLFSCTREEETYDAMGSFEANEIIVSANASGKLLTFSIEEGHQYKEGEVVGIVDTMLLHLQKMQLLSSIGAIKGKTQDPQPQIKVLQEQKNNLLREKRRIENLLKDKAATPKQLDDIQGQIDLVEQQIAAAQSQSNTANRGILGEIDPVRTQIQAIDEQISRCFIKNPVQGTVLLKLAEPSETVAFGTPLYKVASLEEMTLRAYISGEQLSQIKIGQEVTIQIDTPGGDYKKLPGTISWVANDAEFTPKTIRTKEERVNLVYAIKVKVDNDGSLKIGMPAEVYF